MAKILTACPAARLDDTGQAPPDGPPKPKIQWVNGTSSLA